MLADKAQQANMTESEYLRLMISQKPSDYPEIRVLLRELINEVNHIGTNINQIVHNHNSGIYSEAGSLYAQTEYGSEQRI